MLAAAPPYSNPNNNIQYGPEPLMPFGQPAPENNSIENAATRPYQRGTMPRSRAPYQQSHSRFATVITVLILLATLLLLGFSIYLAAELHFISIPGIGPNPTPTAQTSLQVKVPDLRHLDYQTALKRASAIGFILQVSDNNTNGIVINQTPEPDALAAKGSRILVEFGSPTKTVTVPPNLVGNTLSDAEQILTNAGLSYGIQPAGSDPTKEPNTVIKADPPSGDTIPVGQRVILYVANYSTSTPTAVPTTLPTPSPTPTAKPSPSPTPTPTPTPTPSPSPSPTPSPSPSPSPLPDPLPTPSPKA
jgi:hypothetical protein